MQKKDNLKKFFYECVDCGKHYEPTEVTYLCPLCSVDNNETNPPKGVLKVLYRIFTNRKNQVQYSTIKEEKFLSILPNEKIESLPFLKVGDTPLYNISRLDNKKLDFSLHLKDDSQNPTFSFKDRASAIVSAFAKENEFKTIVAASTGNAGSSLAGICAAQNQEAIIMVPESAPLAKLTQIIMYGATIVPVKGTYDDAFDLSVKATQEFGWYNRNTAFNPLTIEGKKTVSFELFEQLNEQIPDRVFVPVGDGVIVSGVYKGFEDLVNLGIIHKMPTIVAVQSERSNNLIRNITTERFELKPSCTVADSIAVDVPRNFYMTKQFIQKYKGEYLSVSDDEILQASAILSRNTGLFSEPAAATSFAGFLNYFNANKLENASNNVVLLTGSGLKDLNAVQDILNIPESILPTIENLKKFIK